MQCGRSSGHMPRHAEHGCNLREQCRAKLRDDISCPFEPTPRVSAGARSSQGCVAACRAATGHARAAQRNAVMLSRWAVFQMGYAVTVRLSGMAGSAESSVPAQLGCSHSIRKT